MLARILAFIVCLTVTCHYCQNG